MTTSLKTCFKCNSEKERSDFYAHPQMKDGLLGKCKECAKKDSTERRNAKIEDVRAYDRQRGSRQGNEYLKSWRERYPNKLKAHRLVAKAVKSGKVHAGCCEVCYNTESIHAHHDNYLKPLEVRWLCAAHHSQWHRDNGEGLNP